MKRENETDHEYLQRLLSELLDVYPGAVILVQQEDGGAIVVSGGAGQNTEEGAQQYQQLLRAAPNILKLWGDQQGISPAREGLN